MYFIFLGHISCYTDNPKTKEYVNNLSKAREKSQWTVVDADEEEGFDCFDDEVLDLEKDKLSMDDQKKRLDLIKSYEYGEFFGGNRYLNLRDK